MKQQRFSGLRVRLDQQGAKFHILDYSSQSLCKGTAAAISRHQRYRAAASIFNHSRPQNGHANQVLQTHILLAVDPEIFLFERRTRATIS